MLKELLSLFRSQNALGKMAADFNTMLETDREMIRSAGLVFFGEDDSPEQRTQLYKTDVEVNKLERRVRKQIIAHLSVQGTAADLPYCLLMMSLVKDAERIGDYAKNIAEVRELHTDKLPENELKAELHAIRTEVEAMIGDFAAVFSNSDRDRAVEMIESGRMLTQRADTLLQRISRSSDCDASVVTALVLGARYYKRTGGHLLNILSGIVMPLHKLDYYDKTELE